MAEIARDHLEPRIRQVAFFLPNRLGALRVALAALEAKQVKIGGIATLDAADHAVVRLVVDRPDLALETLAAEGYGGCATDVLGCALLSGGDFGIQRVLSFLVSAEVNVEYAYALILRHEGRPILVLQVDDLDVAGRILQRRGFDLVGQGNLDWSA